MTDTQALARAIHAARFADEPAQSVTPFDELSETDRAVWVRCAEAAAKVSRAGRSEKSKDPVATRVQHLEEVVRRFRELCREAEAAVGNLKEP
ncbi:hypothetical protein [Phreatobacter stygius]|uniref:Uncharacterized protein n=1 Tax=Phreatobacter stygius TaxID=1940610 RepID=A0A4D7B697_9HYPH|nr:hypothetical protein [Phreatobacter stygius]QCI68834.1 hypothetical protein E8M01_34155 [Phreatobacter stygius]